jgi:hypothetical protein
MLYRIPVLACGLWYEWLERAWRDTIWDLTPDSPCVESNSIPFSSPNPIHRMRIWSAIWKALRAALPAAEADFQSRAASRASSRTPEAGRPHPHEPTETRTPTLGEGEWNQGGPTLAEQSPESQQIGAPPDAKQPSPELAAKHTSPRHPKTDPEIAKRNTIIDQNPEMSASELCKQFDFHNVPLPGDWFTEFQVRTWAPAYKNTLARKRIDSLISKARHRQE